MRYLAIASAALAILLTFGSTSRADSPAVRTMRLPVGGMQPQAAVDDAGVIHVIYLAGDPAQADIFYIRSTDGGATFSEPQRVNSQPGAALAIGTVRGAHLSIGKNHRLHIAWCGSNTAVPKAPGKAVPLLYTRLSDDGKSFEPQKNIIQTNVGLDGGGSVAADSHGNVFVAWHAPAAGTKGETNRHLWLVKSSDEGATFSAEQMLTGDGGACGCCGARVFADEHSVYALYRTSDGQLQRDLTLVRLTPPAAPAITTLSKVQSAICVMSTATAISDQNGSAIAAWESSGQIHWANLSATDPSADEHAIPGRTGGRKHPALAINHDGDMLVAWTEGTGWARGGSIAWQIYHGGAPVGEIGHARSLPVWGAVASFATPNGGFVVIY